MVTGASAGSSVGANIPDQMIDSDGMITVPFAGRVKAKDRTLQQIGETIQKRLKDLAHEPQVIVRLTHNATEDVAVVGEVDKSLRMPLTPRGERLLDALAAAEGVKQPVGKIVIQITRGDVVSTLPLDTIIRDPKQNIFLKPGDVITALYQPFSYTALGATAKNDEVFFEAQGISLVQALARTGGLQDYRSNPEAVFIFRFEPADLMDWPCKPVMATPDGKVPVIYRADFKDPAVFFASENFMVRDKDLIFVSNAPSAEWQKFVSIIMTVAYPGVSAYNAAR
jgi:polysaccharide export outer membrane protein